MTETIQVVEAGDLLCNLKAAVTALECQQKMDMAREKLRRKVKKPPPAPMFMMIPLEQKDEDGSFCEDRTKRSRKHRHDRDSDSDYEYDSISNSGSRKTGHHRQNGCEENKGPTMRGGVLHSRCGCVHRDGLQDFCPLTECQGHRDCLTKPWAVCRPARYFQSRFPDNYPSAPHSDAIMF